jgi:hypothetical protein
VSDLAVCLLSSHVHNSVALIIYVCAENTLSEYRGYVSNVLYC